MATWSRAVGAKGQDARGAVCITRAVMSPLRAVSLSARVAIALAATPAGAAEPAAAPPSPAAAAPAPAPAAPAPAAKFSTAQLEQLVAPIALYPDGLIAQVLAASTYP